VLEQRHEQRMDESSRDEHGKMRQQESRPSAEPLRQPSARDAPHAERQWNPRDEKRRLPDDGLPDVDVLARGAREPEGLRHRHGRHEQPESSGREPCGAAARHGRLRLFVHTRQA
jgi:hypothetical protein